MWICWEEVGRCDTGVARWPLGRAFAVVIAARTIRLITSVVSMAVNVILFRTDAELMVKLENLGALATLGGCIRGGRS